MFAAVSDQTAEPSSPPLEGLAEAVRAALARTWYLDLQSVEVEIDPEGTVFLKGRVNSYHRRQIAFAKTLEVPGVQNVCCDGLDISSTAGVITHEGALNLHRS